jgi:hypothetical protein
VAIGGVTAYMLRDGGERYTFEGDSRKLRRTVIVPTLDTPIPEQKSAIWCLSFQVAWSRLKELEKEPLQLEGAEEVCSRLNAAEPSEDDMTPDMYVAEAGRLEGGLRDRIRQVMAEKFPRAQVPTLPGQGTAAFCYLEADLRYPLPYDERPHARFRETDRGLVPIHAHGVRESSGSELRRQPELLFRDVGEHGEARWFALDLCKDSSPHQLIAAKIPRQNTLVEMLADVDRRIADSKNQPSELRSGDDLLVPDMRWLIEHHFQELEGKKSVNPASAGQPLLVAYQVIDFKMDRRGAVVKSLGAPMKDRAKGTYGYHYDTAYLLYMKQRGAKHPFLAIWIDNAELLQR